jgi:hypothetical protein
MYIPFSYFGGNSCTGSGYGYTFWNNDPTTTDAVTWTSLCNGQAQSANILPSSSLAIAATINGVSGIAANTLRVDAVWSVTGSLNQVVKRNYTISGSTGLNGVTYAYYDRYPNDTYGMRYDFSNSTPNINSYIVPIILQKAGNQSQQANLITDNGVTGSSLPADTVFKNRLTTYGIYLPNSGSNFRGIGPDGKYFLYGTAPSSSVDLKIISFTVPVPVTGSLYPKIFGMQSNNAGGLIESRSCYNYEFLGSAGRTLSYLDCNNQSASVTCIGTDTLQNICAKANSLQFENAIGANYVINSISYGNCGPSAIPLPSGSLVVSQSLWSAIDLAYSNYDTQTATISDLSGLQNNLSTINGFTSWSLATTSSASGSILQTTSGYPAAIQWSSVYGYNNYSLLFSWRATDYFPNADRPLPLITNSDNLGNDVFGLFGKVKDLAYTNQLIGYDGFNSAIPTGSNVGGDTGGTLNQWHVSQYAINPTSGTGSYCIDGITGSFVGVFLPEAVQWRVLGPFINGFEARYSGSVQWQVAAIYTGSLSNDQMVQNWNSIKGRYGY